MTVGDYADLPPECGSCMMKDHNNCSGEDGWCECICPSLAPLPQPGG